MHMGWVFAIFSYTYGVERTARVDETYCGSTLEKARSYTEWVELTVFLANGCFSGFLHEGWGIFFFVALLRFLSIMNIRIFLDWLSLHISRVSQ